MILRTFLAAAALAIATPAAAQDGSETAEKRTVEGAQKFLTDFYSKMSATAWFAIFHRGAEWVPMTAGERPGFTFAFLEGSIVELRPATQCRTEVRYTRLRTKRFFRGIASVPLDEPSGGLTTAIDWAVVSKVRVLADNQDGTNVWIDWKEGGVRFNHMDESDAKRAAFAMDFLREQCAAKSDTGF